MHINGAGDGSTHLRGTSTVRPKNSDIFSHDMKCPMETFRTRIESLYFEQCFYNAS